MNFNLTDNSEGTLNLKRRGPNEDRERQLKLRAQVDSLSQIKSGEAGEGRNAGLAALHL